MRDLTLSVCLVGMLALSACAGPTPVERYWGEAQRNSTEAMISAAKGQETGRGIDGRGAEAAYGNYSKALDTRHAPATSEMFSIQEGD